MQKKKKKLGKKKTKERKEKVANVGFSLPRENWYTGGLTHL